MRCCGLVVMCLLAACTQSQGTPEPVGATSAPLVDAWEYCSRTAVSLGVNLIDDVTFAAPMAPSAGGMVFTADDSARGHEPWVSTGSPGAGTRLLVDLFPGTRGSEPRWFTRVGGQVFFAATDPVAGRELFVTDGTTAGTRRVKDIWPGEVGSFPNALFEYQGLLYFTAGTPAYGRELWRSDGTAAGTVMIADLEPGVEDSAPDQLTKGGDGALYFVVSAESVFVKLMRLGVSGSPVEVFRTTSDLGFQFPMVAVGRKLFFVTRMEHHGAVSLRVTDGGAPSVSVGIFGRVGDMVAQRDWLAFVAAAHMEDENTELWRSDGTVAGTVLVEDVRAGNVGSAPDHLAVLGDTLFFAADNGTNGVEPWDSDGTAVKTRLFGDLELGPGSSFPQALTVVEDFLFFSADVRGRGQEPWVSNGIRVGTVALTELAPGPRGSSPRNFRRSGWSVFFSAEDAAGVRRLYALPFHPEGECLVPEP
ncbi:hypothetical protein LXT21_08555 [Myxococcus sp. K38C18041901]|uniref:ELWxxDGT repeat protein n=1 Tax=Myxococcus guangdongensis TaxID=2906760 RepID=UPI0020A788EC|nr:ELWxxDGT repeat protein [Myxococcus guangdongensis]MCP3058820.1 hypothetical protein [Myxococcus guangdongensis]